MNTTPPMCINHPGNYATGWIAPDNDQVRRNPLCQECIGQEKPDILKLITSDSDSWVAPPPL